MDEKPNTTSSRNSKAGFLCALPVWAIFICMFLAVVAGLSPKDADSLWGGIAYNIATLATALAAPVLFFLAPFALLLSIAGLRERRTRFAWIAFFASIGPFAMLIFAVFGAVFLHP